jgi:cell division septation protein DedD
MLTRSLRSCLALCVALAFAGVAVAALEIDDYASAAAAYQRGDFAEAWRIWQPLARDGDVDAQFSLGMMCAREPPIPDCDAATAVRWYTRAAEAGHRLAQFSLGTALREGRGVARDEAKARYWFGKAATQGLPAARDALGTPAVELTGAPSGLASEASGDETTQPEQESSATNGQSSATVEQLPVDEPQPTAVGKSAAMPGQPTASAATSSGTAVPHQDVEWLAAQDPERYTAQLAASPDEAGLRDLRRRHALEERAHVVCAQSMCYLLLGAFISREDAWTAIATLPERARADKPWPRAFSYYQSRSR